MYAAWGLAVHQARNKLHMFSLEFLELQVLSVHDAESVLLLISAQCPRFALMEGCIDWAAQWVLLVWHPQLQEDMLHLSNPDPAAGRLERRALTRRSFSATTNRVTWRSRGGTSSACRPGRGSMTRSSMSGWQCCRWACRGAAGSWADASVMQVGWPLLGVSGLLFWAAHFHGCVPGGGAAGVLRFAAASASW